MSVWQLNKRDIAIETYDKLKTTYPYSPAMWQSLGNKYMEYQEYDQAFSSWGRAIDLNRKNYKLIIKYINQKLNSKHFDLVDANHYLIQLETSFVTKFENAYKPKDVENINWKNWCNIYDDYLKVKEKLVYMKVHQK